jgi:hypothetical protein
MFKLELLIANTLYQHIFSKPGGCIFAGQTGCARNLQLAALYIVEGLLSPPPLYSLRPLGRKLFASLGATLRATSINEVAHSLTSVRSRYLGFINFFTGIYLVTGQRSVYFETG